MKKKGVFLGWMEQGSSSEVWVWKCRSCVVCLFVGKTGNGKRSNRSRRARRHSKKKKKRQYQGQSLSTLNGRCMFLFNKVRQAPILEWGLYYHEMPMLLLVSKTFSFPPPFSLLYFYSRDTSRPKTLDFIQSPTTKKRFLKLNMLEI